MPMDRMDHIQPRWLFQHIPIAEGMAVKWWIHFFSENHKQPWMTLSVLTSNAIWKWNSLIILIFSLFSCMEGASGWSSSSARGNVDDLGCHRYRNPRNCMCPVGNFTGISGGALWIHWAIQSSLYMKIHSVHGHNIFNESTDKSIDRNWINDNFYRWFFYLILVFYQSKMSKQLLVSVRVWQKGEEPNADTSRAAITFNIARNRKVTAKITRRRQEQVEEVKTYTNTKH